jgi:hypothetical protein
MQWVADDIVDEECDATNAKSVTCKQLQFVRREMMHEEIATHEIERVVSEGQGKGITNHSPSAAVQVGTGSVEKGNAKVKLREKMLPDFGGNKARSGGNFKQGSARSGMPVECAAHELLSRAHSPEPPIEHL